MAITKTKKKVGDWVVITGGPRKGTEGSISELQGLKAIIKLKDGTELPASIAWLDFVESLTDQETESDSEALHFSAPTEDNLLFDTEHPTSTGETPSIEIVADPSGDPISELEPENAPEVNVELCPVTKLTVAELKQIAKQRDISIARTKADFLRIIKELEPDCEIETLKGPALFNKVSELHISRLRSKQDLVELLTD